MTMLQQMTAGVMGTKAAKAAKLTPVAGETDMSVAKVAAGLPDVPEVFLTNEAVVDIARDLRRQAAVLIEVADGLDKHTNTPTVPATTKAEKVEAIKQTEQAADFAANMQLLKERAQAAAFASLDDGEPEAPVAPTAPASGWSCPQHGAAGLTTLTSRKGRVYGACTMCDKFER